ncbi:MAG: hypothetical protein MRY21_08070 [Simkaniaceae bacterium]|nr:hypothetical protein [Simkaniaceae bacterium]
MIRFLLLFWCYLSAYPYIGVDLLDQSARCVREKSHAFQEEFQDKIDRFIELAHAERFEEAFSEWCSIGSSSLTLFTQLKNDFIESGKFLIKSQVVIQGFKLKRFVEKGLYTRKLRQTVRALAMQAEKLTPYERYITKNMLLDMRRHDRELDYLYQFPMNNFEQKFGAKASKLEGPLKVFSANILCFPGHTPYYYGGISPWEERLEKIAKKILDSKAHLVCLQELWDPIASRKLRALLEKEYHVMLYDIGNRFCHLDISKTGTSSGLFIASKLPIEDVRFISFPDEMATNRMNRGALIATCGGIPFISTHLTYGFTKERLNQRMRQIKTCTALLQEKKWGFLVGDLNINAFTPEFEKSGIGKDYDIPYLSGHKGITLENSTATNYYVDLVHTPHAQQPSVMASEELIDYCICLKGSKLQAKSERHPLYWFDEHPLSDHHALITTIERL